MTDWIACLVEAIERAEAIGMDNSPHHAGKVALVLIADDGKTRIKYTLDECRIELDRLLDSDRKL